MVCALFCTGHADDCLVIVHRRGEAFPHPFGRSPFAALPRTSADSSDAREGAMESTAWGSDGEPPPSPPPWPSWTCKETIGVVHMVSDGPRPSSPSSGATPARSADLVGMALCGSGGSVHRTWRGARPFCGRMRILRLDGGIGFREKNDDDDARRRGGDGACRCFRPRTVLDSRSSGVV